MQSAHCFFDFGFFNNTGNSDFRCRNQLDIDTVTAEGIKHLRRKTGGILHARADDTDFT